MVLCGISLNKHSYYYKILQKNYIFLNSKLDIIAPQWNRSVRDLQLPGAGDEGLVAVAVAIVLSLSRLLFYL